MPARHGMFLIFANTRPDGLLSVFSLVPAVNHMGMPLIRTARHLSAMIAQPPFMRSTVAALVLGLLLMGLPAPSAQAYIPSLDEIFQLVAVRPPALQRAMLETRTYVFDPLHRAGQTAGDTNPDAMPPELQAREFHQKIYWIRNAFLGIETSAEDGTPLHFYLNEGFRAVQGDLASGRSFTEADVVHPYLAFVSADPARWRQAINFWGINPRKVDIVRGSKGEVYYRLLEDEDKALWLDPETLRPVRLRTRLEGGEHGGRTLTIEFREFMFIGGASSDAEDFFFPRTVDFLLDGKLFKQIVVLRFEADPSVQGFPITRLRGLAAKVQPPEPVSYDPQPWKQP